MTLWEVREAVKRASESGHGPMITSYALRAYAEAIDEHGDLEAALEEMGNERHL